MDKWAKEFLDIAGANTALGLVKKEMELAQCYAGLSKIDSLSKIIGAEKIHNLASVLASGLMPDYGDFSKLAKDSIYPDLSLQLTTRDEILAGLRQDKLRALTGLMPTAVSEASRLAEMAQTLSFSSGIDQFIPSAGALTEKLLHLESTAALLAPDLLKAFVHTSALSDMLTSSHRVDFGLIEATKAFSLQTIPRFDELQSYRSFLDASGLILPRWPHVRLLTIGEKRRRLRNRLQDNAESQHVRKAKSLVQRYELTLRDILEEVMEETYGADWAEERLPSCDCKDLLGRWRKRGGAVFDHADYAHYDRLMSNEQHFSDLFEAGFSDREELIALMQKAGTLRAALFHFHPFSTTDLRDLRLTWRVIETGLLALTDDYDFDFEDSY